MPGFPLAFTRSNVLQAVGQELLCFTNGKKIHKLRQRLRVEKRADTAGENQRMVVSSSGGAERDLTQIEDGKDIRIVVFKGKREGNHIKAMKRLLRFQRE